MVVVLWGGLGAYLLVPVELLLGEVVLLGMLEEVRLELGEDILKLLERGLLRHLVVGYGGWGEGVSRGRGEGGVGTRSGSLQGTLCRFMEGFGDNGRG